MAKPKKYAHVVDQLPRLPIIAPERREIVEAVKAEIISKEIKIDLEHIEKCLYGIRLEIADLFYLVRCLAAGDHQTASIFAASYARCRAIREQIDSWSSSMGIIIEAYQWLMVDAMQAEGLSAITLTNGQPVSTWQEPYAKVEDKEAFRQWCDADPDLRLKMALPWQTTNELAKSMLLHGQASIDEETGEVKPAPMPPGVTIWALTKVRLGSE